MGRHAVVGAGGHREPHCSHRARHTAADLPASDGTRRGCHRDAGPRGAQSHRRPALRRHPLGVRTHRHPQGLRREDHQVTCAGQAQAQWQRSSPAHGTGQEPREPSRRHRPVTTTQVPSRGRGPAIRPALLESGSGHRRMHGRRTVLDLLRCAQQGRGEACLARTERAGVRPQTDLRRDA
ncbi:Uncharacterised protein [Mycobacteroides abscessus subsp. abscessus]|nr:Uncharacterised protein [Mycobacteroides abscessus subsp. abscessus]